MGVSGIGVKIIYFATKPRSHKVMHEENLELNAGINVNPIDSKEFARGVYYITIQTASSVITKQLVIQ